MCAKVNASYYERGGPAFILIGGEGQANAVWFVCNFHHSPSALFFFYFFSFFRLDLKNSNPTTRLATDSAIMVYAQQFSAIVFQLEHRFYGATHPLPDLSLESLQYLSSEQVWPSKDYGRTAY